MTSNAPPPPQQILQLLLGKFISRSLTAVADLSIADALHQGPQSVDDLAKKTETNADALYRVLRALAAVNVFRELPGRKFENNPLSDTLRADSEHSTRAMVRWINDPAGWRPWGRLDYSIKTGQPATEEVLDKDVFSWLQENPSSLEKFQDAMTGFSAMTAHAVAEAYDFSDIEKLVDVGGGHGMLLGTILNKYNGISGVLFDRPEVTSQAQPVLTKLGVADKVEVVPGDFFEGVSAGADAYILKFIIHDWDDERSAQILGNCRKAMKPGGKVLVVDTVLNDSPEATFSKLLDLEMLVMTPGGRERTEADFAALFDKCGLKLSRIVPTESPVSVVEAVVD